MSGERPLVSIVTATYNRSGVLRTAIASAQRSTVEDYEHLVIGDACTDDSREVVASFGDPRLSFHNLEGNLGEQSGPNNAGCRLARGKYIAFLNHDDLWFEDHLSACLEHIEATGADLVCALGLALRPQGSYEIMGALPEGRYEPYFWVPASLWLFRRELAEEVGPWRYFKDCRLVPSQDWLVRAWGRGKRVMSVPRLTVIAIQSGSRPGSYTKPDSPEHEACLARMVNDPRMREKELTSVALALYAENRSTRVWPHLRRALGRALFGIAFALGLTPVKLFSAFWRKGSQIDALRRTRGLPTIPSR